MGSIVFVTTAWGTAHGGVNAFNADLCEAVSRLTGPDHPVLCVVLSASPDHIADAERRGVGLITLDGTATQSDRVQTTRKNEIKEALSSHGDVAWLVGHDDISGPAAVATGASIQCPVAVIQHTDYASYASQKGVAGEQIIRREISEVDTLAKADVVFGVGPKLAAAARDRLRHTNDRQPVGELVPGLADVEPLAGSASTFRPITFGRLDPITDRIKLGRLAVEAFGRLVHEIPEVVGRDPRITMVGLEDNEQAEIMRQVERAAGRVVAVIGHPFTESREVLFQVLRDASVCLMLSLHEGYGLTGWEALSAEVPLIVSKNTGLYALLEGLRGPALGCVRAVEIRGSVDPPFYREEDVAEVTKALREIANDQDSAKANARSLRQLLRDYTWQATARGLLEGLGIATPDGHRAPATTTGRQETVAPIFSVPVTTRTFHGRTRALAMINEGLARTGQVAIHGLGGVGKTQLAARFAREHREDYDVVWWVRAEQPEARDADIARLALRLGLALAPAIDRTAAVAASRDWLERHGRWLVVLDNVRSPEDLDVVLPERSGGGHVLITSRAHADWGRIGATALALDVWTRTEAIAFLETRTAEREIAVLDHLAAALGDLPLALEQAVAYSARRAISLGSFCERLARSDAEVFTGNIPAGYGHTVQTTWRFENAAAHPPAHELLKLCAFLAPDRIPRWLLSTERCQAIVGTGENDIDAAIELLLGDALLTAAPDGRALDLHRLVAQSARDGLSTPDRARRSSAVIDLLAASFPSETHHHEEWPVCEELASHAVAALGHAEGRTAVAAGRLGSKLAMYHWRRALSDLHQWVGSAECRSGDRRPVAGCSAVDVEKPRSAGLFCPVRPSGFGV